MIYLSSLDSWVFGIYALPVGLTPASSLSGVNWRPLLVVIRADSREVGDRAGRREGWSEKEWQGLVC